MSKITIDRAVLEQALEVLTENREDVARCELHTYMTRHYDPSIAALRKALGLSPASVEDVIKKHLIKMGWTPPEQPQPQQEPMTHGDLDLCRQWFGCIQDTNPSYLGRNDCALAAKLYTLLGLPIPKELQGVSAHGIKDTP